MVANTLGHPRRRMIRPVLIDQQAIFGFEAENTIQHGQVELGSFTAEGRRAPSSSERRARYFDDPGPLRSKRIHSRDFSVTVCRTCPNKAALSGGPGRSLSSWLCREESSVVGRMRNVSEGPCPGAERDFNRLSQWGLGTFRLGCRIYPAHASLDRRSRTQCGPPAAFLQKFRHS